jgi:hypothetical protein
VANEMIQLGEKKEFAAPVNYPTVDEEYPF